MMMGDLVLTRKRDQPGDEQAARGGHPGDSPAQSLAARQSPTFYMHVAGTGDPAQLAAVSSGAALEEGKNPFDVEQRRRPQARDVDFDTAEGQRGAVGTKGKANGGVYQFGIPAPIDH